MKQQINNDNTSIRYKTPSTTVIAKDSDMVKPQPYMVPFLKSTFRFTKWGSLFDMKGVEDEIKRRTNDSNDFNNVDETSKMKSGPSSCFYI